MREQGEEFPQLTADDAQRRAGAAKCGSMANGTAVSVVVAAEKKCLVHAGGQEALERVKRGYPVNVSGCDVPQDWLQNFTASRGAMSTLGFIANHSRFAADADFRDIAFREESSFSDAYFGDGARFDGATFAPSIGFDNARFGEAARSSPQSSTERVSRQLGLARGPASMALDLAGGQSSARRTLAPRRVFGARGLRRASTSSRLDSTRQQRSKMLSSATAPCFGTRHSALHQLCRCAFR